jgi:hypothetical protein
MTADENGVVEEADCFRPIVTSQEEGVIDEVVFGFGTKLGAYPDSQVTALGSGHYANYVFDG